MRIKNYINGIEGVATGGVAVANVPVNRRYFDFRMFVTGNLAGGGASQTAAQLVTNVRVYVNSVVIIDLTSTELRKIALLNGLTLTDDQIQHRIPRPAIMLCFYSMGVFMGNRVL